MSNDSDFLPYSICIPNYNNAEYLLRKIPQCLAQTFMPEEILIIDDGSTDNSREVIEKFAQENACIRVIIHPKNLGVNAAVETILKNAKSDFIVLSAADDLLSPDFGEQMMRILTEYPTAGLAFSDPAEVIEYTEKKREVPLNLSSDARYFTPQQFSDLLAANYFSLPSHASIFRRQALLDFGGFNPELQWCADWVVGYALAFTHGVCYVPKTLAYFTVRDDSISGIGRINPEKQKNLVRIMLNKLRGHPYDPVRTYFRSSALLIEYRLRDLPVIVKSDREYITPLLLWRIIKGEIWHHSMNYLPMSWRRKARNVLGNVTRYRL